MTANKHAAGPWELRTEFGMQGLIYPKGSQYPVASTTGYFNTAGQTAANASLIAAAPELLEAAMAFIAPFDGIEVVQGGDIAKARAAIAKATGGAA